MPDGVKEGIVKGIYKFKASTKKNAKLHAQLFGSGTILNEVLKAREILEEDYKVAADVWSVTSYKELRRDALETERYNLLHPGSKPKESYIQKTLKNEKGVFVASSDYVKALPDSISKWIPRKIYSLGTDGFGRSEGRKELRDFFEVDAKHIVLAALYALANEGSIKTQVVEKAVKDLKINPSKRNPMTS
jgi:pyruvate dehydrogenase E1 component